MAVVTVKSTQITNRDAVPAVFSTGVQGNAVFHARGVCAITSGNLVGSRYIACSVPSNAVVLSVRGSAPDIGVTTAADIGLYRNTADGGAVVSAAFFASAQALNAGPYLKLEVSQESGTYTIANKDRPLWQALGLTRDPQVMYDLAATLTGAADATGNLLLEIDYTQ